MIYVSFVVCVNWHQVVNYHNSKIVEFAFTIMSIL